MIACAGLLLAGGLLVRGQVQDNQDVDQREQILQEARQQFMRGKLSSNQKIVEGLSLKNFAMIRDGAESVTALVKGQHWFVLDSQEYKDYSKDMEQAAQLISNAAEDKNLESAALRYFDLTLTCIDCHQYLERQSQ